MYDAYECEQLYGALSRALVVIATILLLHQLLGVRRATPVAPPLAAPHPGIRHQDNLLVSELEDEVFLLPRLLRIEALSTQLPIFYFASKNCIRPFLPRPITPYRT